MSRSVSAPSSVTNTSPCWNGLIVPGSTFRYGSNFWTWTLRLRAFRSRPSEAATIPLPRPETTPPVTNTYFVARSVVTLSPRDANVPCSAGRHVSPRSELGRRLDERVQAVERSVREGAAEADQPGAGDGERRDRPVGRRGLEPELGLDPLARELEDEPLRPRGRGHEEHPARVRAAEEARPVRAANLPARAGGEAAAVGLDGRDAGPPVGEVARHREKGPHVLARGEELAGRLNARHRRPPLAGRGEARRRRGPRRRRRSSDR